MAFLSRELKVVSWWKIRQKVESWSWQLMLTRAKSRKLTVESQKLIVKVEKSCNFFRNFFQDFQKFSKIYRVGYASKNLFTKNLKIVEKSKSWWVDAFSGSKLKVEVVNWRNMVTKVESWQSKVDQLVSTRLTLTNPGVARLVFAPG